MMMVMMMVMMMMMVCDCGVCGGKFILMGYMLPWCAFSDVK